MLRRPAFVCCAVSLSFALAVPLAHAQSDGAPVPAPADPPPAPAPAEPTPPPATPAPPAAPTQPPATEPAPPPATPPGTPPSVTPPGSPSPASPPANDAFPLPPSTPPTGKKPKRAAPTPSPPAATPASPPPVDETPQRPTQGLFEERPQPASTSPSESPEKEEGTDQFKIGPVAGIGIPSIISFGGTLKLTRFLGAGINIGLIPKVQLAYYGKATLSYQHYDIYGRIYPFGGGFFLSGGAGYATVDGTLQSSYSNSVMVQGQTFGGTANYDGKGSVRTLMLTALIGYFYTTSIGFSFGVDAGAQIPIAPSQISFSSRVTTTPKGLESNPLVQDYKKTADDSVRSSLEKIGRTPLPTLNLRIGWIL